MTVRPPLRIFASATLFAALCLAQPFALAQQNGGNGKGWVGLFGSMPKVRARARGGVKGP